MQSFEFCIPTKVIFGEGSIEKTGEAVKEFGKYIKEYGNPGQNYGFFKKSRSKSFYTLRG
jgi:alcohol dehydrogenase YqhD (iron-dependent ADH family)